jgi:hypothetical protein
MSGRKALAADLWFRSGRSAAQEGDTQAATRLRRAETLARQTGQPALANEARGLRLGLKSRQPQVGLRLLKANTDTTSLAGRNVLIADTSVTVNVLSAFARRRAKADLRLTE